MAGKINNQIENPDPLKTLNSLFLFNFIYVFIEPSKKTVGKIIGNKDGRWNIASLINMEKSISLLAPLLINSIRSIEKKSKLEKMKTIKKENKCSFNKYLKIITFLTMT